MSTRAPHRLTTFATFLKRFYPEFLAPSWAGWRSIAAATLGEEPEDPAFALRVTGRSVLPKMVRALIAIAGRGAGKSRFCGALFAVFFAFAFEYFPALGESIYVCVYAPTVRQATLTFKYIAAMVDAIPTFAQMVVRRTTSEIELTNNVIIQVLPADYRTVRGQSIALAVVEEASFLPSDESAAPDTELLRALRPGLARVPNSLLVVVGTAYARKGEMYRGFKTHYGNDESTTLVVKATTRELNETFDQAAIDEAYAEDPVAAGSEFGADFRSDIESYLPIEALEQVIVPGRTEAAPDPGRSCRLFLDPAGGGGSHTDSYTGAVAYRTTAGVIVVASTFEARPPFSPDAVTKELADWVKPWRIVQPARSDRWAGGWPADAFSKYRIRVAPSEKTKSELYAAFLRLVNSRRIELPDLPRLRHQLLQLERRVARGGRESIDHPAHVGAHDDLANAVAGAAVLADEGEKAALATITAGERFDASRDDDPLCLKQAQDRHPAFQSWWGWKTYGGAPKNLPVSPYHQRLRERMREAQAKRQALAGPSEQRS